MGTLLHCGFLSVPESIHHQEKEAGIIIIICRKVSECLHHCSIFSNVKPKVQCIICCFQSLFPCLPLPSPSNPTVLIFDSCVSEEDINRIHWQENFCKPPSISLYGGAVIFISILSEKIRSCCESAVFKKPPGSRLPALVLYMQR